MKRAIQWSVYPRSLTVSLLVLAMADTLTTTIALSTPHFVEANPIFARFIAVGGPLAGCVTAYAISYGLLFGLPRVFERVRRPFVVLASFQALVLCYVVAHNTYLLVTHCGVRSLVGMCP